MWRPWGQGEGPLLSLTYRASPRTPVPLLQRSIKEGIAFIPPYDDPYTIAGQGTIGDEILRQIGDQVRALCVSSVERSKGLGLWLPTLVHPTALIHTFGHTNSGRRTPWTPSLCPSGAEGSSPASLRLSRPSSQTSRCSAISEYRVEGRGWCA